MPGRDGWTLRLSCRFRSPGEQAVAGRRAVLACVCALVAVTAACSSSSPPTVTATLVSGETATTSPAATPAATASATPTPTATPALVGGISADDLCAFLARSSAE